MEISGINTLTTQILWAGFILSMIFGAIVQRSHFCTMGAVGDIVNMGDWTRMRMWGKRHELCSAGCHIVGLRTRVEIPDVAARALALKKPSQLSA